MLECKEIRLYRSFFIHIWWLCFRKNYFAIIDMARAQTNEHYTFWQNWLWEVFLTNSLCLGNKYYLIFKNKRLQHLLWNLFYKRLTNKLLKLERAKGFEPSTSTLARSRSTPELHPHQLRWQYLCHILKRLSTTFFIFFMNFYRKRLTKSVYLCIITK